MTTIDHAAKARELLNIAVEDSAGTPWDLLVDEQEQWHVDALLSAALVHAQLALVNEQRIANVLAYLDHAEGDEYARLHDDIKKGMGL